MAGVGTNQTICLVFLVVDNIPPALQRFLLDETDYNVAVQRLR
jgi:hypothetical protein